MKAGSVQHLAERFRPRSTRNFLIHRRLQRHVRSVSIHANRPTSIKRIQETILLEATLLLMEDRWRPALSNHTFQGQHSQSEQCSSTVCAHLRDERCGMLRSTHTSLIQCEKVALQRKWRWGGGGRRLQRHVRSVSIHANRPTSIKRIQETILLEATLLLMEDRWRPALSNHTFQGQHSQSEQCSSTVCAHLRDERCGMLRSTHFSHSV